MKKLIEKFFLLFFRKKAEKLKKDVFLERQESVLNYAKAKKKQDKYLSKYSGRKRYVKA